VGAEVTLTEVEMELRSLPEQIRDTENAIGKEREKLASKEEHDAKLVKVRGAIPHIHPSTPHTKKIPKQATQPARAPKLTAEKL
ncbi:exonuclease, partial [Klebsiella pneumoniae]